MSRIDCNSILVVLLSFVEFTFVLVHTSSRKNKMMWQGEYCGGLLQTQVSRVWLVLRQVNFREQHPDVKLEHPRFLKPRLWNSRADCWCHFWESLLYLRSSNGMRVHGICKDITVITNTPNIPPLDSSMISSIVWVSIFFKFPMCIPCIFPAVFAKITLY